MLHNGVDTVNNTVRYSYKFAKEGKSHVFYEKVCIEIFNGIFSGCFSPNSWIDFCVRKLD